MSDYLVARLYVEGVRAQKHVRLAGRTRGKLSIKPEQIGRRLSLVARLAVLAADLPQVLPLFDVSLLGTSTSCLVLAGYERVEPTILEQKERLLGQTWLVEPAGIEDAYALQGMISALAREREDLRDRLQVLLERHGSAAAPP